MRIAEISPDGRLLELQHAAYAVEAKLIGDDRIPPLRENLADLQAKPLAWLGAFEEVWLAGAVAYTETPEAVDIDRLIVDPAAHRRGIGRALVEEVLARAGTRKITVATGRENVPARTLYENLGFQKVDDAEPVPGLWITEYSRPA
ncbi:GNAT family N-acetyltransferase [Nonomuraea sp. NPDC050556]|uniref:GNAT family N-acetyltransferase n=1 Tax=Nonomuraea sp. NPDC050556 TaxID=3364369 RepID=UPI0037B455B4